MKIGCIGLGNMGSAILNGIFSSEKLSNVELFGFDSQDYVLRTASENFNLYMCKSAHEVVKKSDVIILAVKPQVLDSVLSELYLLEPEVLSTRLIISIVAGKSIEYLEKGLGVSSKERPYPIVRVMPNINAVILSSTSAYAFNKYVPELKKGYAQSILSTFGSIVELPEKQFSAFTALCGSSPAFTYMYIEALALGAIREGMTWRQAVLLAADVVIGSAKMVLTGDYHPMELCDMVCSPAGTTIEGVAALKEAGFEDAVLKGIKAISDREKQL